MEKYFYIEGINEDGDKILNIDGIRYTIAFDKNNTPSYMDWHPDRWRALPENGEYYFDEYFIKGDKDMPIEVLVKKIRWHKRLRDEGDNIFKDPNVKVIYKGDSAFIVNTAEE